MDETELDEALKAQKDTGQPLGEVLIGRGTLSRLDLASALAEQWAGLEKLRPPSPKPVEAWQQVAPVEHAAAAAQAAARSVEPEVAAVVSDPSLADAVSALSERVAAVEAEGASDAGTRELRASFESLAARLDALEAGGDGNVQAVENVAGLRAALDELRERIDAPETRLGLVEGRVVELELERAALDGVRSRLAALEKGSSELASRDDLDGTIAELSTRLEGLDTRLDEAASGARSGLEVVLETLADVQERLDAVATSQQAAPYEGEIAALRAQLEEIAGAGVATAALVERVWTTVEARECRDAVA